MYYHRKSMTAFLANPRTASRSVASALKQIGFTMEGSHHSGLDDRAVRTSFCVVRHHCDALVSWGEHLRKPVRDEASLRYVLDRMSDQKLISEDGLGKRLFPYAEVATNLIRFERLVPQLASMVFLSMNREDRGSGFDVPHLGRSDRPDWREIFTPAMEAMVARQYGEEMWQLGYTLYEGAPA